MFSLAHDTEENRRS